MSWDAAPTDRCGRQQTLSDAAIQTCLSMKLLLGMASRHTTETVESLLRIVRLGWIEPEFSTLSHRQKSSAMNIPYPGSLYSCGSTAPGSKSGAKASSMPASMVGPNGVSSESSI